MLPLVKSESPCPFIQWSPHNLLHSSTYHSCLCSKAASLYSFSRNEEHTHPSDHTCFEDKRVRSVVMQPRIIICSLLQKLRCCINTQENSRSACLCLPGNRESYAHRQQGDEISNPRQKTLKLKSSCAIIS